ncbi:histone deacetylase (class I) Clr6 [Psilocybe cubensis]|nr:histone deacetylase (class I) Clr6 [Psilocybe cubensis]KAH9482165.1 histone deacetylase (class I) Clr6 [Psilocybe cubensis]
MHILKPKRATPEVMSSFHTDEYVNFLHKVTPETAEKMTYHGTRFLVGEDNPAFEGVFEFCSISAGGSIGAAQRITSGAADIAINWAGGLHHAKKREASGFCYINDIVLGTLELLRTYPRVLYIDIDCHHGDGVEEAFYTTDRVMTCSFHKFGEYFPGTGSQDDRGRGKGKGYAVNVPFKDGITDESFKSVFEPVITRVLEVFRPSAVVLQCGSDSLAGDKLGCFNLTMKGHANCVQFLRKQNIPLILLGGGGYTVKNVARTWTYETACALGIENEIDPNLPWNQYFEWFGPRYRLEVPENNMEDLNVKEGTLDSVREAVLEQLQQLQCAPSVQMQDVPRESVRQHLGFGRDDEAGRDELDEKLAQHARYLYNLQETDTTTDESEESDFWDSDESSTSANWRNGSRRSGSVSRVNGRHSSLQPQYRADAEKRRMSLLTGKYYDIPTHEDEYAHYECGSAPNKSTKRRFFSGPAGGGWDDFGGVDSRVNARSRMANGFRNGFLLTTPFMDTRHGEDGEDDDNYEEMLVDP